MKIQRALLSVSDKSGLLNFAKGLHDLGIELLSTGGTAKALKAAGLNVTDIADFTGFPKFLTAASRRCTRKFTLDFSTSAGRRSTRRR
ncbi:MAG: hypothetical protein M5U15_00535 [Kiritimatiellae bacterium]|nr:hypothetical protein [Kiritimatiellia bacterium]